MKRIIVLVGVLALIAGIWVWPPGSWLVKKNVLDGQFDDWDGKAYLSSEQDRNSSGKDFQSISWAINDNEQVLYFMVKLNDLKDRNQFTCRLFFDINANGTYKDVIDKYAEVTYQPISSEKGRVKVKLFNVAGRLLATYSGLWGTGFSNNRDPCFEFNLSMEKLNIYPAQSIRFYLTGIETNADRLPDHGDNQWAPFPMSVKSRSSLSIACLLWLAVTIFFYRERIWVFYYIWGAVGLCCLLVLLFRGSLMEYELEHQTSVLLHYILSHFNIVTYVFDKAPGTLLVLIKLDHNWTTIDIDIENSGFLEMCIFLGLAAFYPVFNRIRRIFTTIGGVIIVYGINLIRLLVVVFIIHAWGRNISFIAHTVIGRLVFFILVIAVYWQLLTKPSLNTIREIVKDG